MGQARPAIACAALLALALAAAPAAAAPGKWSKRIDPAAAKRAASGDTPYAPPGAGSATPRRAEPLVIDRDPEGLPYVAGELLVTYGEGASGSQIAAANDRVDADTDDRFGPIDARALELPAIKALGSRAEREARLERRRRQLEADPRVESADYNYVAQVGSAAGAGDGAAARSEAVSPDELDGAAPPEGSINLAVNDPEFPAQWGLPRIRAPQAWDTALGQGTLIAVLDSGIQTTPLGFPSHDDIGGIVATDDFIDDDGVPDDNNGHGTHVAGIAGATTDNGIGIAGTSPGSSLYIGKVCEDDGGGLGGKASCPVAAQIAGLIATADFGGVDVINMSLGGYGCPPQQKAAVDYAAGKGVVVVAAAGNDDVSDPACPASFPSAIAVSSTNIANGKSNFSNFGDWVDVAAPGGSTAPGDPPEQSIRATYPTDTYAYLAGTSMSAPFVSGVASLLAGQGLNATQIRKRILYNAFDLPPAGKDPSFGHGLLNAQAAVLNRACINAQGALASVQRDAALAQQSYTEAAKKAKKAKKAKRRAKRKAKKAKEKAKETGTKKAGMKAKKAKKKAKKAKKKAKKAKKEANARAGELGNAQNGVAFAQGVRDEFC